MFQLDIVKILIKREDGVEMVLPGVLKNAEIVPVNQSEIFHMGCVRKGLPYPRNQSKGNILVNKDFHSIGGEVMQRRIFAAGGWQKTQAQQECLAGSAQENLP